MCPQIVRNAMSAWVGQEMRRSLSARQHSIKTWLAFLQSGHAIWKMRNFRMEHIRLSPRIPRPGRSVMEVRRGRTRASSVLGRFINVTAMSVYWKNVMIRCGVLLNFYRRPAGTGYDVMQNIKAGMVLVTGLPSMEAMDARGE